MCFWPFLDDVQKTSDDSEVDVGEGSITYREWERVKQLLQVKEIDKETALRVEEDIKREEFLVCCHLSVTGTRKER